MIPPVPRKPVERLPVTSAALKRHAITGRHGMGMRWLRMIAREFFVGCSYVGAAHFGVCHELPPRRADEPPPASPERLARHVPPTPEERRLWAQLGHPT
jgi:hypothetical protein